MAFSKLERFRAAKEIEHAKISAETAERAARLALKNTVRDLIPKSARVPKRPKGRTAVGGLTRKEVAELRRKAVMYLDGEAGMEKFKQEVQRTVITILLIDGVFGTEPWRAAGSPHGGLISANARLRYLEQATRILEDLQRGGEGNLLTEGIVDAEPVAG